MILNIISFRNCSLERNLALRTNEPIDLCRLIDSSDNSEVVTINDVTTGASIQFRPDDVLYISSAEETDSIFDNKSDKTEKSVPQRKGKGIANIGVKNE